ncbi:MAG TPA: rhodanese-like domain-containing protein [bacterium]|nr:rhodanese-like domain-containing protein [bacterium]HMW36474.1 rhodanese-like domain-containing protein [bacterium]HMY36426.1 rhodanese-like domain-containing protein [bacterium]HMZ04587.1 rhodanese-like domain-containing protein [bacterium]HNB10958.1 rhodanese-like domain-containing protein [bacterium]
MKLVAPDALKAWIDEGKVMMLLDVREPWEHAIAKLPDSVLIPLGLLNVQSERLTGLDKTTPVVAYCHHGMRSQRACAILESLGFTDVYNLTGGIDYYSDCVDPTIEKY